MVAVAVPAVWLGLIVQAYMNRAAEKQEVAQGISNCRQIITAVYAYASDHRGGPDGLSDRQKTSSSSNQAFKMLFAEGILENELIFGCPQSPYQPDGKIGTAPHFVDALKAGENHWMFTPHLSDSPGSSVPFVYENAAVATWNPKWNADAKRRPLPGRTWTKGIIIGMHDKSVALEKLAATEGTEVPLKAMSDNGNTLFTQHGDKFEVLDVER
ncbi:hypothetical protein [Roseimicrobium gellanilyticum]|nr:hypothetical protein [Roseimicrobium gellanilyticum]